MADAQTIQAELSFYCSSARRTTRGDEPGQRDAETLGHSRLRRKSWPTRRRSRPSCHSTAAPQGERHGVMSPAKEMLRRCMGHSRPRRKSWPTRRRSRPSCHSTAAPQAYPQRKQRRRTIQQQAWGVMSPAKEMLRRWVILAHAGSHGRRADDAGRAAGICCSDKGLPEGSSILVLFVYSVVSSLFKSNNRTENAKNTAPPTSSKHVYGCPGGNPNISNRAKNSSTPNLSTVGQACVELLLVVGLSRFWVS